MRTGLTRGLGMTLIVIVGAAASARAQVWQRNIADTYQHQRWGAPAGSGPAGAADAAPSTTNWEATFTAAVPATPTKAAVPENVIFRGWCYPAAVNNVFYRYSTLGFSTYDANNVNSVTKLHDELKTLRDLHTNFLPKTTHDTKRWASILNDRKTGPKQGIAKPAKGAMPATLGGIVPQQFQQVLTPVTKKGKVTLRPDLRYWSSDGTERTKGENSTIFDQIPTLMGRGDSSVLIVQPSGAAPTNAELNWWDFHAITVAGYKKPVAATRTTPATPATVFFSDPDSNMGNGDGQSGWTAFLPPKPPGVADWKAAAGVAPGGVATKQRRYNEAAVGMDGSVPGPFVAGAPPAADQASLYFTGTLTADEKRFNADTGRYSGVKLTDLLTFERARAANLNPPAAPLSDFESLVGATNTFEVTLGAYTSDDLPDESYGMTEFYLFPKQGEYITTISNLTYSDSYSGSGWSYLPYLGKDPLDPDNPFDLDRKGWHFTANPNPLLPPDPLPPPDPANALIGNEFLTFDYETLDSDPIDGWDLVYNSFLRDPLTGAMLSSPILDVQVVGADFGYEALLEQGPIPEPGTLSLLALGVLLATGRRWRAS